MTSVYLYSIIYKLIGIAVADTAAYYFLKKFNKEIIAKLLTLGSMGLVLLIMYKFLKVFYIFYFHKSIWHLV